MNNLDIVRKKRTIESLKTSLKEVEKVIETPSVSGIQKPRRHFALWGISIIALLTIVLLVFFILPEGLVLVKVRTEPVTRDLDIRVDQNQTTVDQANLTIPGKILEKEIVGSDVFSATGTRNVGKQASGFVNIFNFSKNTLILRADTTILSVNDRQYRFTQDVGNIRPTAFIGLPTDQEVDPSSLIPPVPVFAELPGIEFNLPIGTRIEIKNEVFGHQPAALYAEVAEAISGGTSEELKVVSVVDVLTGFTKVREKIVSQARAELYQESTELRLLDTAMVADTLEESSTQAVGARVEQFEVAVRVRLRALVYSEADVRKLIEARILRLLPPNKTLAEQGSSILQSSFLHVSLDQGFGVLANHYEGEIVYQVDEKEILGKVRGRSEEEIREILLSRPEIAIVEIKFYPFWVKKAPHLARKIRIELQ